MKDTKPLKKPVLVCSYTRNSEMMAELPAGHPCKRIEYSYEPLRKALRERGCTWTDVRRICKITTNAAADLSLERPVSLDTIACVCYYFDLTLDEAVEITFVDSEITEEDKEKAVRFRNAMVKRMAPKETALAGEGEPLITPSLHTPVQSLNVSALVAEQKRQEAQKATLPPKEDTSTAEEEKPVQTRLTGSEKAEPDSKPGTLPGKD